MMKLTLTDDALHTLAICDHPKYVLGAMLFAAAEALLDSAQTDPTFDPSLGHHNLGHLTLTIPPRPTDTARTASEEISES